MLLILHLSQFESQLINNIQYWLELIHLMVVIDLLLTSIIIPGPRLSILMAGKVRTTRQEVEFMKIQMIGMKMAISLVGLYRKNLK